MKQFNLEEYIKNPSRKVITRDGRNVRIICTDAKGICPIVGLVAYENYELAFNIMKDGRIDGILDLFFAPEKHERWINLYKDDDIVYASMDTFKTKEKAEAASCSTCIATVKIEWEE